MQGRETSCVPGGYPFLAVMAARHAQCPLSVVLHEREEQQFLLFIWPKTTCRIWGCGFLNNLFPFVLMGDIGTNQDQVPRGPGMVWWCRLVCMHVCGWGWAGRLAVMGGVGGWSVLS